MQEHEHVRSEVVRASSALTGLMKVDSSTTQDSYMCRHAIYTLVNSQLVCLPPVGILNLVTFIYECLFALVLKSPNGEWNYALRNNSFSVIKNDDLSRTSETCTGIFTALFP